MTWLEILWWSFWRSLEWRQHERPSRGLCTRPLLESAPNGENRDAPAVALVDRHGGLPQVARP